jgi:acyl-coenzyme A synthetase/AMP-(fatty) acid ligase
VVVLWNNLKSSGQKAEATNTGGWRIVEKYRATIIFTSLAAIRALKRQDPEISPQI